MVRETGSAVTEEMLLKVSTRVRLVLGDAADRAEQGYKGVIAALGPSFVALALEEGAPPEIEAGSRVTVVVPWEGCAYRCRTEVMDRHPGPPLLLRLARPTEVERLQRRSFVRLPLPFLPVRALFWSHERQGWQPLPEARAVDISAGGMLLATAQGLPGGTRVMARFRLPMEDSAMAVGALVVRCQEAPKAPTGRRYRIGIRFDSISERQQHAICRFILRRQAQMCRTVG